MDILGGLDIMIFYYLIIGMVIGFMSSTVGLGGSILAILILLFDMDSVLDLEFSDYEKTRVVIANTMVTLVATNIAVSIRRKSNLLMSKDMLFSILLPAVIASAVFTWLIVFFDIISIYMFTLFFLMMMAYTSYIIFTDREKGFGSQCWIDGVENRFRLLGAGLVSGVVSATTACEPSPIIVPLLNRKCNFTIQRALEVFITVFYYIALTISIIYIVSVPQNPLPFEGISLGYVVLSKAVPMALGSFFTAFVGYDIFRKANLKYIAYITTFILSLFTIRVFFMDIIKPLY